MKRPDQDEFAALSQRVNEWRANGSGRTIPADIWRDAVELASSAGAYATSRATGLSYTSLRNRCKAREGGAESTLEMGEADGTLDDLAGAPGMFVSLGSTGSGGGPNVLEVMNSRGERLRIESLGALDTVGLTRMFLGRDSCSR